MEKLKICSFNLRMEASYDGKNMFSYRTLYIREAIRRESPDFIGFQEVLPHMHSWLIENFPEYITVGCGRGSDYKSESNPVLFKKDKFDFLGYDMFWLSPTPFIPGSRYEIQSDCPRICVVITLKTKNGTQPFRVYNTHLDHVSDEARKQGIRAILKRMEQDDERMAVPHLLLGDLNALPDSDTIRFIRECESRTFTELTEEIEGTFHSYGQCFKKIDYIFASSNIKGLGAKLWDECHNGVYLSDHYPVCAEFEL